MVEIAELVQSCVGKLMATRKSIMEFVLYYINFMSYQTEEGNTKIDVRLTRKE